MATSAALQAVDSSLEAPVIVEGDDTLVNTFNFTTFDPVHRLGALLTMNSIPGDPTMWRGAVVGFHPSGDLLLARGYGRSAAQPASANLRYTCVTPFTTWDLDFDGVVRRIGAAEARRGAVADGVDVPMRFHLRYASIMPAWGHVTDGEVAGTHYEQNGRITGTWMLPDEQFNYAGVGFRDRIVGPKRTALLHAHNWIHGTWADGRAFALTFVALKSDPAVTQGSACLLIDGEVRPAHVVEMPMWDGADDAPGPIVIVLDAGNGPVELTLEPIVSAPWTYTTAPFTQLQPAVFGHDRRTAGDLLLWESPARVVWSGDEGFGHIERSAVVA